MNPLDSFTVEILESMIHSDHAQTGDVSALAKIALAAKRSEKQHVRLEVNYGVNNWVQCSEHAYERRKAEGKVVRKLYEHPAVLQLPDGWVIIPKKATNNMIWAYKEIIDVVGWKTFELAHEAMLAAAPKPDHIVDVNEKGADGTFIDEGTNGWIKCSDRMPKVNGSYLTWDGIDIVVASMLFNTFVPATMTQGNITHWMPRPDAPKPE